MLALKLTAPDGASMHLTPATVVRQLMLSESLAPHGVRVELVTLNASPKPPGFYGSRHREMSTLGRQIFEDALHDLNVRYYRAFMLADQAEELDRMLDRDLEHAMRPR